MEPVRCYDCQQPVADSDISVREVRKGLMAEKKPICPTCVKKRDEQQKQVMLMVGVFIVCSLVFGLCGLGLAMR